MLIDVDKVNDDRAQPMPTQLDVIPQFAAPAKGTNSVNYTSQGTNLGTIRPGKNGQFTIVQTGILYTQTFTASSPNSSTWVAGSFTHAQVPHNLGYTPAFVAYGISTNKTVGGQVLLPEEYENVGNLDGTNNPGQNGLWMDTNIQVDGLYVYLVETYLLLNYVLTRTPNLGYKYYLLQQTSTPT